MTNGRKTEESFQTFHSWTKSLARHLKSQNTLSSENGTQMRRTLRNQTSNGTPHIQTQTSDNLENT